MIRRNNKADANMLWIIIGGILALIVLFVFISIYGKTGQTFGAQESAIMLKLDQQKCVMYTKNIGRCDDPKYDIDQDCQWKECDICSFDDAKSLAGATTLQRIQYDGSNICDKDSDGMADACDDAPLDFKIRSCKKSKGSFRCNARSSEFETMYKNKETGKDGSLDCIPAWDASNSDQPSQNIV